MPHQESYKNNEAYAEFLQGWDPKFYAKYTDTLKPSKSGERVLDVGCGVGQVVARLQEAGYEAHGVDVSEPNIQRAQQFCPRCQIYNGRRLPFENDFFQSVGALNVLEHVDEPEIFIPELVRVLAPGGKIVISSPNFFRVLGYKDYHPKMRGFGNKWRNFWRISEKKNLMGHQPQAVRFDRMQAIVRKPFQPDDDAIVATNPFEMAFFLQKAGCEIKKISCTDRYVSGPLEFMLNATPLRLYMFNAFLVAKKK